jgi:hypothetical protein
LSQGAGELIRQSMQLSHQQRDPRTRPS